MPKTQTKNAAPGAKKKPGNRGDFHGAREVFLTSQLPEYFKKSKQKKTREFWPGLMDKYFQLFPWRLDLEQDPDPEDGVLNEVLSKEEVELKMEKMSKIKSVRS